MSEQKENNQAVRRVCAIFQVLKGNALNGLSLQEIAEAINVNSPSTLRLLQTLEEERMVTQYASKRWALAMGMMQIAHATASELNRGMTRITEMQQRIQAGAAG